MLLPRSDLVRIACATLALAVLAAALAQAPLGQRLEVVDAQGTSRDVSDGTTTIDLDSDSDRRLVVRALPLVRGAASVSVAFDGVAQATVDLEVVDREIVAHVARSADDIEEIVTASTSDPGRWPAGFTYRTSSDLELGYDPSHGFQLVYVAFDALAVAPNAEVVRAAVRFTADGDSDGALTLRVAGASALPADAVLQDSEGSASATLTAVATTHETIDWVPEPSWRSGDVHETPDLAAIVAEAWSDRAERETGQLRFLFAAAEGDGTRRAFSFDGNREAAPELVLVVREPAEAAIPIQVPVGTTEVTIAAHPERAGRGAPLATATFQIVASAADAPAASDPAAETLESPEPTEAAPAPATTEGAADPAEPPLATAPELAPSLPSEPTIVDGEPAIWIAEITPRATGSSNVTVVLTAPVGAAVVPALRFGTCTELGDLLTELTAVPAGERGSTTVVGVSAAVLRLSGIVAVLEGVPGACVEFRP